MVLYNNPYGYNPYNYNYMQPNQFNNTMPQQNNFMQPQAQQPQLHNYAFVNGVEGAKGYQIQPNQTMVLMDSDNPFIYMKQANAMGQSQLRYFKLTEVDEATARGQNKPVEAVSIDTSKFISREEFNAKIEELMAKINPTKVEV